MKLSTTFSIAAIASLFFGAAFFGSVTFALGATTTTSECVPTSDPFLVTATSWGTSSSPVSAAPGDQNDPLTVTLLYNGGCPLAAASFDLALPEPFTTTSGSNRTTSYEINVAADSTLAETFRLDIGANATLGSYTFPLHIGYNTTDFTGLFFESTSMTVSLKGTAKLEYAVSTTTFTPGKVNNFTLSVTNAGTGAADSLSTTITGSSQVSVLTQPYEVKALQPGTTVSHQVQVYVPSSLSGSAVTLSVTSSFVDPYSIMESTDHAFGFVVSTTQSVPLALGLTQVNDTMIVGTQSTLVFVLSNVGEGTIYSPTISISVSSPIVVTNSSGAFVSKLQPRQTSTYRITVGSSPSSTPGIYEGTITVSYTDSNGGGHTEAFPVGFVLLGSIEFIIQEPVVSQTATSVTISGSLLNEGTTNAYYAEVSGKVGSTKVQNSSYVGEVDTNTPTPFTLTISYPAPTSPETHVPVSLTVTYKNNFGTVSNQTTSITANLESGTQLALSNITTSSGTSSSGGDLLTLVSYAVVAVIVVALIGATLYVRRTRSASRPPKEDRVI